MTTDIIELSKQVAEVLGVPANRYRYFYNHLAEDVDRKEVWLAEDHARCAEIAADKRISTDFSVPTYPSAYFKASKGGIDSTVEIVEDIADHNGDRKQAWRVAVLKAVIEQGKQS